MDTGISSDGWIFPNNRLYRQNQGTLLTPLVRLLWVRTSGGIQTFKHLMMTAFHELQVDNLLVAVDDTETPLGDDSAQFFMEKIL